MEIASTYEPDCEPVAMFHLSLTAAAGATPLSTVRGIIPGAVIAEGVPSDALAVLVNSGTVILGTCAQAAGLAGDHLARGRQDLLASYFGATSLPPPLRPVRLSPTGQLKPGEIHVAAVAWAPKLAENLGITQALIFLASAVTAIHQAVAQMQKAASIKSEPPKGETDAHEDSRRQETTAQAKTDQQYTDVDVDESGSAASLD